MNITKRIKEFADEKGLGITELERIVGASSGTLSRACKKGTDVQSKWLEVLLQKFPELSAEWLMRGNGSVDLKLQKDMIEEDFTTIPMVRVIDLNDCIKYGSGENKEEFEPRIPWPGTQKNDFAINISGAKTSSLIEKGGYMLLREVAGWKEYLEYDCLYVIELEDGRKVLKEIKQGSREDCVGLTDLGEETSQEVSKDYIKRVFKAIASLSIY